MYILRSKEGCVHFVGYISRKIREQFTHSRWDYYWYWAIAKDMVQLTGSQQQQITQHYKNGVQISWDVLFAGNFPALSWMLLSHLPFGRHCVSVLPGFANEFCLYLISGGENNPTFPGVIMRIEIGWHLLISQTDFNLDALPGTRSPWFIRTQLSLFSYNYYY